MLRTALAATLIALGLQTPVSAQTYPDRPVRLVVPYAPGGGGGYVAQALSEFLSEKWGQRVYVDNKPGAGSALGIDLVAKSKPDGYSFVHMTSDGISVLPAVKPSVPYKVPEDFSFVAGIVTYSYSITAAGDRPYKTMAEMIAWAKANPGKIRVGNSGVGSGTHLTGELIARTAGIEMVHVPFSGAGPGVTAVVGGHIDLLISTPSVVVPHIEAGKVRSLATTDKERHMNLPNVPTLVESGLPALDVVGYYGILGPAGIPEPILQKWREGIQDAHKDPKFTERMAQLGFTKGTLAGDAFKKFLVDDLNRWKQIAKESNITVQE